MSHVLHLTPDRQSGKHLQPLIRQTSRAGRVYYLIDDLSFGPVPMDPDNFYPRYQWLEAFFGEYSNEAQDLIYYRNQEILTELDDHLRHSGSRLILWTEDNPNHRTWLCYLSMFFQDWESVDWVMVGNPGSMSRMDLAGVELVMEAMRPPSSHRIMEFQDTYDRLRNERSLLRVLENDTLVSYPVEYFDARLVGPDAVGVERLAVETGMSLQFLLRRQRQILD